MKLIFFTKIYLMFIIIYFVLLGFIVPNQVNAYSSDPKQFITEIVNEVKKILVEENSKEYKKKSYQKLQQKQQI